MGVGEAEECLAANGHCNCSVVDAAPFQFIPLFYSRWKPVTSSIIKAKQYSTRVSDCLSGVSECRVKGQVKSVRVLWWPWSTGDHRQQQETERERVIAKGGGGAEESSDRSGHGGEGEGGGIGRQDG